MYVVLKDKEWFMNFSDDILMPVFINNGRVRVEPNILKYYYENVLDEYQRDDFENFVDLEEDSLINLR